MQDNSSSAKPDENTINKKVEKLQAGLFFTFITTISILSSFGLSLSKTKKQEAKNSTKPTSTAIHQQIDLHESGAALARRALGRATLYSVSGFSLFCFLVWKASGANSFDEFRLTIGNQLPRINNKKNTSNEQQQQQQPGGRTEFSNLTDLFQYIIDEDKRIKEEKNTQKPAEDHVTKNKNGD